MKLLLLFLLINRDYFMILAVEIKIWKMSAIDKWENKSKFRKQMIYILVFTMNIRLESYGATVSYTIKKWGLWDAHR